jgi:hypothetical protein
MSDRLAAELDSFQTIWRGGYYEGDPLDPMTQSGNSHLGYMSALHVAYLACIKPYVDPATVALEIGPGRGAWTRAMLPAQEVWAVDALPADHNGFYEYLGHPEHVRYVQATDFSLGDLPDDHFTYMFSYGALCHVSFEGITEYARSTYTKMSPGAHCFWMVADYEKYNRAVSSVDRLSPWSRLLPGRRRYAPARAVLRGLEKFVEAPQPVSPDVDDVPRPGRWYDAGIDRTCELLESVGYTVLDRDMGVSHRDPVIHFQR